MFFIHKIVNFTVQTSKVFFDDPSQLQLNYDNFMVAVNIQQDDFVTRPFLNITLQQRVYTKLENGTRARQFKEVYLEPCRYEHWSTLNKNGKIITQEQFNSYNFTNYLCPQFGTNFTIGGQYESKIFEHLKFTITACKNSTYANATNIWRPKCAPPAEIANFIANATVRVQFQISNYILNPTTPVNLKSRYVSNDLFFQLQPGNMYRTADIYFTENMIEQDTNFLPYENFQSEAVSLQEYGDYREQFTFGPNPTYGAFFFNRSRFSQIYQISFQKVDDLISQIGGFFQSVLFIAAALVGFYNQEYYTIELANKIYDFDLVSKKNNKDDLDGKGRESRISRSKRNTEASYSKQETNTVKNQFFKLSNMITGKFKNDNETRKSIQAKNQNQIVGNVYSQQLKESDIETPQIKPIHNNYQFNDQSPIKMNNKINNPTTQLLNGKKEYVKLNNSNNINSDNRKKNSISNNNIVRFTTSPTSRNRNSTTNTTRNKMNTMASSRNRNSTCTSSNYKGTFNNINTAIKLQNCDDQNKENPVKYKNKLDELNHLLNLNISSSPGQNRKKEKRVESAACYPTYCKTASDMVKYQTVSPLTLTDLDKKKEAELKQKYEKDKDYYNIKSSDRNQLIDKMTNSDENELVRLSQQSPQIFTLSPKNMPSSPKLFSLTDRKQEDKNSLIFFDQSSIDPESSIDESSEQQNNLQAPPSPIQRRERNESIFRTLQPTTKFVDHEKMFKVKSYNDLNSMNQKEFHSFKSLRESKVTSNQNVQLQDEISQKGFLNAYREQMRKDFMSKQLEKALQKRSKLKITLKYFIFRLSCGKLFCTKENLLIQRANDYLQKDVDIIVILNKIKELEKLKCLLMDSDQLTLFNYFPKPFLSVGKNKQIQVNREEKIKVQKKFEQQCKSLQINPLHFQTIKKAKEKFKSMLSHKKQEGDQSTNIDLINNMNGPSHDYQKLFKAYEKIANQNESSRMDQILVNTLGEETKKVFQESLQQFILNHSNIYLQIYLLNQNEIWYGQTTKLASQKYFKKLKLECKKMNEIYDYT